MRPTKAYEQTYFEGIYTRIAKEKKRVLESFFNLLIQRKAKIEKILDLGCGEGDFLAICRERGLQTFGIDISAYALDRAKKKLRGKFLRLDLSRNRIPFGDNEFDAITCFDLLEHLSTPTYIFSEVQRVLKPGGTFFMTTPNRELWLQNFFGLFFPGDKTHINVQSAKYWHDQLEEAGFNNQEIKGCFLFGFPPCLDLRSFLNRLKISSIYHPFFVSFLPLATALFVFARKKA